MEAAEETLTYRNDTGLHKKLLKHEKDREPERKDTESNYVDLDMRPDGPRTVKVTFTGDGNQLSVSKSDTSKQGERKTASDEDEQQQEEDEEEKKEEDTVLIESLLDTVTELPDPDSDAEKRPERDSSEKNTACSDSDELRYTDMCLNSKTESDDGTSAADLSDHCGSDTVEDESHYITTHEIQLTELDHDVDYDLGRGTRWEFEDGNLVYSFVDYASFESDDPREEEEEEEEVGTPTLVEDRRSHAKAQANLGGAAVSTEQEESDLCSSDESLCRNQNENPAGEIHLSIQTSSRAVNDPSGTCWYTKHLADRSHFVSSGARAGPLADRVPYFIPAPGRQHLATKLRRKDINEYSSGASSSFSELDDADKEVRNLTAKSFRSLACPYFDAINLSTSSESSVSEYGLNKWSAYVDWNYGKERSVIAHKTSSATLEMSKTVDGRGSNTAGGKDAQTRVYSLNKRVSSQQAAPPGKKIQMREQAAQRGVTLNFRCTGAKCAQKGGPSQVSGAVLAGSGCEVQCNKEDGAEDTHKRAIFASSLLKNVISKKMQFEQERKMERGEICDSYPSSSPCFNMKDQEKSPSKGLQMQTSESADDQNPEGGRSSSCAEETKGTKDTETVQIQSGAFRSIKEDEPQPEKEAEPASQATSSEGLDSSSVLTKLLFVPSWQLLSKDRNFTDTTPHMPDTDTPECEKDKTKVKEGNEKGGKPPEIKICLRNVKESKGCTLNIANLLTPKINYDINKFRAAEGSKYHVLSAVEKVPNFTVRDIRDTKCKFQTPIYHVRDVRKLVKSSYSFVSLDNSESKTSTAAEKLEEKVKVDPMTHLLPSPMVIKCNSVKTDVKSQATEARAEVDAPSETSQSENTSSLCATSRTKQGNPDQSEMQTNLETKLIKQRQDERRSDAAIPKQDALEKIKAAVKTMEQLYVFDRNEWKRKTQASHPVADSHVLSLLARDEQTSPQSSINATETGATHREKRALNIIHVPYNSDTFKTQSPQGFTNKSVLHFSNNRSNVNIKSDSDPVPQSSAVKSSKASVAPLAVKLEPQKQEHPEPEKAKTTSTNKVPQACSDSENYLTIPGLGPSNEPKLLSQEPVLSEQKWSPLIMEYPAATIYHHHPTAATSPHKQQQALCFSPSVPNVSPTPSAGDTVPQTQRKMLLDPTTGHYYLVDAPIQATTKRLFDPETGQYVDVPMPHSPVAPITPVPLPLSPLALSPGTYTPTYMICPGFIPSPTLSAQAVMPQSPCHFEDLAAPTARENAKLKSNTAERAYYSATGEAPQGGPLHLPVSLGHVTSRGSGTSSDRKALISITTQQGPRIIAPPSFDGKTMSFVVEHR
ncbi:uncharacterized protein C4orf54 [Kryptolebias marmoratus]|uniref:Chromosome 4 open reading frame 54 n=1 Tax=Kryptolebias marmoratus TaxID=37003 RepID=A0A3Q2Z9P4_KRYMA|nr:uncharacterized protein C4orf54 [Kryptolebias marmoratus]